MNNLVVKIKTIQNKSMSVNHILSYNLEDLKDKLLTIVKKKYHVKQILEWVFKHYIIDFNSMTNIPEKLRQELSNSFLTDLPEVIDIRISHDKTKKFLIKLKDDNLIEMVYMPGDGKNALCISSQVGCSRKCTFCATAKLGLKRNLQQEELLLQLILAHKYFPGNNLTNLVLMGMGEPLDNLENIKMFLKILQAEEGFSFSGRRTTISTCGIIPKIYELADSNIKIKLAVSLNSAIEEKRNTIMPINIKYPLTDLKSALFYFRKKTNFRITFEYIMIQNFNMQKEDIKALIKFCGDISCKINLIKWNEVPGLAWKSPTDQQVEDFISHISHIPASITVRKSRGSDIDGACGQLAGALSNILE